PGARALVVLRKFGRRTDGGLLLHGTRPEELPAGGDVMKPLQAQPQRLRTRLVLSLPVHVPAQLRHQPDHLLQLPRHPPPPPPTPAPRPPPPTPPREPPAPPGREPPPAGPRSGRSQSRAAAPPAPRTAGPPPGSPTSAPGRGVPPPNECCNIEQPRALDRPCR